MALPSVEFLQSLKARSEEAVAQNGGVRPDLKTLGKILDKCRRLGIKGGEFALSSGVKTGTTMLVTSTVGVSSGINVVNGVTLFPIGAALGPFIAAASIAYSSKIVFDLHDIYSMAKGGGGAYQCSCGKCAADLRYVIDKKEGRFVKSTLGVFTGGVATVGFFGASIFKSFQSGRPKEVHSKSIVESARSGCNVALATILRCMGGKEKERAVEQTLLVLVCSDGWKRLKSYI